MLKFECDCIKEAFTGLMFVIMQLAVQVAWAHIDAAGPMWDDDAGGATGWGAALLARWVVTFFKQAHTVAVHGFKQIP